MLLFRKPLSDIQIGESFQVTVTREDWDAAAKEVRPRIINSQRCVLARAFAARIGSSAVAVGPEEASLVDGIVYARFSHNGHRVVSAFDLRGQFRPTLAGRFVAWLSGEEFPAPPAFPHVVTFTRES